MAASRIQRYALMLSAYQYSIEYRPGKRMQNAECRCPQPATPKRTCPCANPRRGAAVTRILGHSLPEEIRQWTGRDPTLARVLRLVQRGWPYHVGEESLQPYFRRKMELSVLDGCLLWGLSIMAAFRLH